MTLCKTLMVRDLPQEERPREKGLLKGVASLSDAELLAILLRTGTRRDPVMRLAERLLTDLKGCGLAALARLSPQEMSRVKGIGPAKAVTVLAAIEIGQRLAALPAGAKTVIASPGEAARYMMARLRYETKEKFVAMLLSTKNHVLAAPVVSVGTLNASLVHPREVFKEAVAYSAASVILVHNHPSGDATPSQEDLLLTRRLAEAGKLLDIAVLDHVIIGDNKYVSLREKGIMG